MRGDRGGTAALMPTVEAPPRRGLEGTCDLNANGTGTGEVPGAGA
jgi:hypothetical protein